MTISAPGIVTLNLMIFANSNSLHYAHELELKIAHHRSNNFHISDLKSYKLSYYSFLNQHMNLYHTQILLSQVLLWIDPSSLLQHYQMDISKAN